MSDIMNAPWRNGSVDIKEILTSNIDESTISLDHYGAVKSRFSDPVWYVLSGSVNWKALNFKLLPCGYELNSKLWVYGYSKAYEKEHGQLPSGSAMYQFFTALFDVSVFCERLNISVIEFFESNIHISSFIYMLVPYKSTYFRSLLHFVRACKKSLNIDLRVNGTINEKLRAMAETTRQKNRQHPVIPTRIFSERINNCQLIVTEFLTYKPSFKCLLDDFVNKRTKVPENLEGCEEYFDRFDKGGDFSNLCAKYVIHRSISIPRYLKYVQFICKELIHIYSGMRNQEVLDLRYQCLPPVGKNRQTVKLIGNTTKFSKQKKQVQWVTSEEIEPAVEVLRFISRYVKKSLVLRGDKNGLVNMHLFISASALNKTKRVILSQVTDRTINVRGVRKGTSSEFNEFISSQEIRITEEDLNELKMIDPLRDWSEEGFGIGDIWYFTSHQYRRSLAVYSAASGLVQLGTLKRQLKHLLAEMSLYYREGAVRAKRLFSVDGKNHMAAVYERSKAEAEFLYYIYDVVFTSEELLGTAGKSANQQKPTNESERLNIYKNKEETIKAFNRGEKAYKETALGGCESLASCEKVLTGTFSSCLGCTGANIKPSKLDNVIRIQSITVNSLDINSVEYRSELGELQQLQKFRAVNQ